MDFLEPQEVVLHAGCVSVWQWVAFQIRQHQPSVVLGRQCVRLAVLFQDARFHFTQRAFGVIEDACVAPLPFRREKACAQIPREPFHVNHVGFGSSPLWGFQDHVRARVARGRRADVPRLHRLVPTLIDFHLLASGGNQTNHIFLSGFGHRTLHSSPSERLEQQLHRVLTGFVLAVQIPETSAFRTGQRHLHAVHVGDEDFVHLRSIHNAEVRPFNAVKAPLIALQPPYASGHQGEGDENVKDAQI